MVIIDVPRAWEAGKGTARYSAVDFICNKLAKDFSVYLDDAIRACEQEINVVKALAYYYSGNTFTTELFIHY